MVIHNVASQIDEFENTALGNELCVLVEICCNDSCLIYNPAC